MKIHLFAYYQQLFANILYHITVNIKYKGSKVTKEVNSEDFVNEFTKCIA